jgi:hypothetical protein
LHFANSETIITNQPWRIKQTLKNFPS